jgi:hypothetical protein
MSKSSNHKEHIDLAEQLKRLNDNLEALTPVFNTIWKTSDELANALRETLPNNNGSGPAETHAVQEPGEHRRD